MLYCLSALLLSTAAFSNALSLPHFYNKTTDTTPEEKALIQHVISSYEKAIEKKSKLSNYKKFAADKRCNSKHGIIPYYHLINNLCSLPGTTHLHIGLYTGGSFVGAVYNNQASLKEAIGIDWFQGAELKYDDVFNDVCHQYLGKNRELPKCKIISGDCFQVDKSIIKNPVNVYVYDAGHEVLDQEMAFTYYNDIFSDVFVAIVDDWAWPQVRQGTFEAFAKLGYTVLYENELAASDQLGNGQYLAVIRKNPLPIKR